MTSASITPRPSRLETSTPSFAAVPEKVLPTRNTVLQQLERARSHKENVRGGAKVTVGGAAAVAVIAGGVVGALALFGALSNPIGWGVLVGVAALALTAAIVGTVLIAKHSEHPLADVFKSAGVGVAIGALIVVSLLFIVAIAHGGSGGGNFGGGFVAGFGLGYMCGFHPPSFHILCPCCSDRPLNTISLDDARKSSKVCIQKIIDENRGNFEDFPKARAAAGKRLLGEEKSDPRKEYECAVELVKKERYDSACDILWHLYDQNLPSSDKEQLAIDIAILTRMTKGKRGQQHYYHECRQGAALGLLRTMAERENLVDADPNLILSYYLLTQDDHTKKGKGERASLAHELLGYRYIIAKNRPAANEKTFAQLMEQ